MFYIFGKQILALRITVVLGIIIIQN